MDTNLLKYTVFLRTVEHGSFTKAAELLSYSQSGVSRMIGDLEKAWGVTLLERSKAGVKLTADGSRLLPYVRSLCDAYDKLQREADDLLGVRSGLIRIGTFSSVATHWAPGIIAAFQRDYPGIDYELLLGDYAEIEEWISDGRVDCGFLTLPTVQDFQTIFLDRDPLMAVLPEDHPLAEKDRVPVTALCDCPFMLLERRGKADVAELFARHGLKPNVRFTTWDDYAIMSMVESGLGVSILPALVLTRNPYRIVAKELEPPAYRSIGIALRDRESAPAVVKRFLDYLPYRTKGSR